MTVVCALKQEDSEAIWLPGSAVTSHQLSCARWPSAHLSATWIAAVAVDFTEYFTSCLVQAVRVTVTQLTGSRSLRCANSFPIMYLDHKLRSRNLWEPWMPVGTMLKNLLVSQIELQIISWLNSRKNLCHQPPSSELWNNSVPVSTYPESLRLQLGISSVPAPAWDKCMPSNL